MNIRVVLFETPCDKVIIMELFFYLLIILKAKTLHLSVKKVDMVFLHCIASCIFLKMENFSSLLAMILRIRKKHMVISHIVKLCFQYYVATCGERTKLGDSSDWVEF